MAEKKTVSSCDICANFAYNEETETYECMAYLDEDEVVSFLSNKSCLGFRLDDEYGIVRKQN